MHAAAQPSHDKAASIPFDDFDINMCVDINKMCGVIDNVKPKDLDRLWMKRSGACG